MANECGLGRVGGFFVREPTDISELVVEPIDPDRMLALQGWDFPVLLNGNPVLPLDRGSSELDSSEIVLIESTGLLPKLVETELEDSSCSTKSSPIELTDFMEMVMWSGALDSDTPLICICLWDIVTGDVLRGGEPLLCCGGSSWDDDPVLVLKGGL